MRTPRAIAPCLAALAVAGLPASAAAFYGSGAGQGALVVSASLERLEQADDRSTFTTISRDGRYVVFETKATNLFADGDPDPVVEIGGTRVATDRLGGIFRRDLASGATEKVADGDLVRESDGGLIASGARNPSVSADGRYVAFSTAYGLVANDPVAPRHRDVYVRDMSLPECRPLPGCAPNPYTIVSALNGASTPITYAEGATAVPGGQQGSEVWPGTSISADGRRVALRTVELASDAPGAPLSTPGVATTDAGQLLLRDLDAATTELLTRHRVGGAAAGGASGPATISGDGGAVAWVGRNAQQQTPFLDGEPTNVRANYYLWRGAGTGGPTRRITGFVDPEDPGCPPDATVERSTTATGPCYGPLTDQEEVAGTLLTSPVALSDDGLDVTFLTPQSRRGAPSGIPNFDVYTTSLRAGLPRKATTVELTREAIGDDAASRSIEAIAMTGDARYIALASSRVRFALPTLRQLGAFGARALIREIYVVDRVDGTIERAARALDGGDPNADAESAVSLSADGGRVAFTSSASNLFFGDGNGRPDAFVAFRQAEPSPEEPPPEPPPGEPEVTEIATEPELPTLAVRALAVTRTGRLTLEVRSPAAGTLVAEARGRLPGSDGRRRASAPIRRLARTTLRVARAGRVRLELALSRATVRLLRRVRRLSVNARVTFTAGADRPAATLTRSLRVTFAVAKRKTTAAPRT